MMIGALGVLIPYTILTISFDYPNILRKDTGMILASFHAGGPSLILTWLAFAMLGMPLLLAYILIGKKINSSLISIATPIGIISGIAQIVGLLRWVFVVPVLAAQYVSSTDPQTRNAIGIAFEITNQFGGVLLGEYIGQLFTVIWTTLVSVSFLRLKFLPSWVSWLGIISSAIYATAAAELMATVIPEFPNWGPAGFVGSTLWIIWLFITGLSIFHKKEKGSAVQHR
jgi:hypothetical protein